MGSVIGQQVDREFSVPVVLALVERPILNKQALMTLGEALYRFSYAFTDDDDKALETLNLLFTQGEGRASDELRNVLERSRAYSLLFMFASLWADQAFPQIEAGQKYAAALMATKLGDPAIANDIRAPWRAFLVEIPPGLLPLVSARGNIVYGTKLFVYYRRPSDHPEGIWSFILVGTDGTEIWRINTAQELLREDSNAFGMNDDSENRKAFDQDVSEIDSRSMILAIRLVFGMCLAMSDPTNVAPIGRAKSSPNIRVKGSRIPPQVRVFKIGKPIELDVRQAIQTFALQGPKRKGSTPSIQQLVRGHWKPRLAARLGHPVWIEPYYRGPEGAPILIPRRTSKN